MTRETAHDIWLRHHVVGCVMVCLGSVLVGAATQRTESPRAISQHSRPAASVPPVPVQSASVSRSTAAGGVADKPVTLVWNKDPGVTYWVVYSGPERDKWTTNVTVFTNSFTIPDKNLKYGIASVLAGMVWPVAYWPSNRIYQLVTETLETPTGPKLGETKWIRWTNQMEGPPQLYQRIRADLVGYQ